MTNNKAKIYRNEVFAGMLEETDVGYIFQYDLTYLNSSNAIPISLTLPLQKEPYISTILFPFFDGLIPEGYVLQETINNWKLNPKDRFKILLKSASDSIGNVVVKEVNENE